ncbi:MAG: helix-turn-helix domain-containing protein [Defluviitaleaceae bacterium]|nr:helix-turn-helix domain-containing protein [Defluviitaleaceae bacterium]MCL2276052.1 helix-turn-helix domain-containing protein [Defluviitaleaceae bacterium]
MIIAERLQQLRREKNMSKREIVNMLPLNYSTYANYESGFREPNSEVLQTLSRYFGVSIDYLIGATENRMRADEIAVLTDAEHSHIMQYRTLDAHGRDLVDIVLQKETERLNFPGTQKVVNARQVVDNQWVILKTYNPKASAGLGFYLSDESDTDYELVRFAKTPVSEKADFCVRILGDSMEPKMADGDTVFVKAAPKVEPEDVGIFIYEGESYCKRLHINHKKGTIQLESLNTAYAPKIIDDPAQLRTVGLVIGVAE